ncbi:MAG: SusC/RagA family TonB-linked outer membrane protein, partial [Cytophagaceae bacterium]
MKNSLPSRRHLWRPASLLAFNLLLASPLVSAAATRAPAAQITLDRKITVRAESQTIEAVLDKLAQQLNVQFVYSPTLIGADRRVTLQVADKPLTQVLDELLAPRKIQYEVRKNRIILSQTKKSAATVPVSGRVTDSKGEGIPGVTVLVRGTTIGATTDATGKFSLNAPEGSTLVFSSVGYTAQDVPLTGATTGLAISLKESAKDLGEIVVVGYGTQERQSVTGAVASVSGRQIAAQPVSDAAQAIQGRAAGVTVTQN